MKVSEILRILEREELYNESLYTARFGGSLAADEQTMIQKLGTFVAGFFKPKPETRITNQINDLTAEKDKLLGQKREAHDQSHYGTRQPLIR